MLKYFSLLFLAVSFFLEAADCFSYEVFEHDGLQGNDNRALAQYSYRQIKDDHFNNPNQTLVLLGRGGGPWNLNQFIAPLVVMNLANVNLMITRRLAHGVDISETLLDNLDQANNLGLVTNELRVSLQAGGYFRPIESIFNSLTLNPFPLGTILGVGVPILIPTRVVVHFSIPQRLSKNIKEISYSSLPTGNDLTLKDKIDDLYNALGLNTPDSATVISSDTLQN